MLSKWKSKASALTNFGSANTFPYQLVDMRYKSAMVSAVGKIPSVAWNTLRLPRSGMAVLEKKAYLPTTMQLTMLLMAPATGEIAPSVAEIATQCSR